MTIEEVKERVEQIRLDADNDDKAHCAQDALYVDVLRAIATLPTPRAGEGAYFAIEALKVEDIEFCRWYA